MNVGGRVGSDPLVLAVTTPFGGDTIQWSFVVLDEFGHQVGTGVSPKYTNNDPNNAPTTVSFNITELPETVDASTTFERKDTFLYSNSAGTSGGYTWSNASGVIEAANAAVPSSGSAIQEVTGATIATKAGVVGMVWKQNDRYFLQGIPVDQNTDTLDLVGSHQERLRPSTVPALRRLRRTTGPGQPRAARAGRHLRRLLRPQRQPGLHHRRHRLGLDRSAHSARSCCPSRPPPCTPRAASSPSTPTAVAWAWSIRPPRRGPAWPPTAPVQAPRSACSSRPPPSPSPTLARSSSSRLAPRQLAAFDLNGNPVKYFGTDPNNLQYTQPLANPGTYLDLAVDGANHIYLLYYTNDGSQPGDYHLDVYNPNGTPLTTLSTGINVAEDWPSTSGAASTASTSRRSTRPAGRWLCRPSAASIRILRTDRRHRVKLLFNSLLTLALLSASSPLSAAAEPAAAPVAQAQGVQCLRQETPPPPPDGGAVIAGPLDPGNSEPNVIVIQGYVATGGTGGWEAGECGPNAQAIMRQPTSIAVASPANGNLFYGAVIFRNYRRRLSSAWGAVSASSTSPPLVLFPGRPDFAPHLRHGLVGPIAS